MPLPDTIVLSSLRVSFTASLSSPSTSRTRRSGESLPCREARGLEEVEVARCSSALGMEDAMREVASDVEDRG